MPAEAAYYAIKLPFVFLATSFASSEREGQQETDQARYSVAKAKRSAKPPEDPAAPARNCLAS